MDRIVSLRSKDGFFEGFSDAGVACDAANLLLSRFVGEHWPEDSARVVEKTRHILTGRHPSGLFRLYPGGPPSVEATRIVCLALERVLEANGHDFPDALRVDAAKARSRALAAIDDPPPDRFEITYFVGFRLLLDALDENATGTPRLLPAPKLALLLPVMFAGTLPRSTWRRSDRIVYPFISVLPQLVSLTAWRAADTSHAGGLLARALDGLPRFLWKHKARAGRVAARWLLDRQDATGGFYYSPLYTYFFIAGLRSALEAADSPSLEREAADAIARAHAYIRLREANVPTGISTSFVASDVWDTAAVAPAFLEAPPHVVPSPSFIDELAAYVLRQQSESGGYSYGRGSRYPDVDTTGLVIGLFAAILENGGASADRETMLASIARAFDFLEKRRGADGGFNAWTIREGTEPPTLPAEMTSLLFDVSSTDVTARVLVSLARLHDLVRSNKGAAEVFGSTRKRKLARLEKRALDYLLSARDPDSGLWPARWTLGYIIGTRFVFDALERFPSIRTRVDELRDDAARTLLTCQNSDGGFGESAASDMSRRFTPSPASAPLVTAAAFGILRDARVSGAQNAAARALDYLLDTQRDDGGWPEVSLCTQFAGLYASYELMTQVAVATTLFRGAAARKSPFS